jgi:hypothetical protein
MLVVQAVQAAVQLLVWLHILVVPVAQHIMHPSLIQVQLHPVVVPVLADQVEYMHKAVVVSVIKDNIASMSTM